MSIVDSCALSAHELYRPCSPDHLTFETTAELPDLKEIIGQPRAVDAIRFGVGMRAPGYNVFALGPPGIRQQRSKNPSIFSFAPPMACTSPCWFTEPVTARLCLTGRPARSDSRA